MVYFCHVVSEEQIFKSIFVKHVKKGLISPDAVNTGGYAVDTLTGLFIDLTDIYICIDIMNMN
jgi:hypothetical protein